MWSENLFKRGALHFCKRWVKKSSSGNYAGNNLYRNRNSWFSSNVEFLSRKNLPASMVIPTRVQDTDLLGHLNNVSFYSFMDSAICNWAASHGDNVADVPRYVVETGLKYHSSGYYPDDIEVRFGVKKLGNSSVEYKVGMFSSSSGTLLASGKFVHVYVSKDGKPRRIPDEVRNMLEEISLL